MCNMKKMLGLQSEICTFHDCEKIKLIQPIDWRRQTSVKYIYKYDQLYGILIFKFVYVFTRLLC